MKHGFLILTHFSPYIVYEHICRLQHPNHYFIIHFDKKVVLDNDDIYYKNLVALENVTIVKNRTDVKWAGFSMLPPILELIREGIKNKEIGYFHLLSTECLHVKSWKYIHDFFEMNKGKEYIHLIKMTEYRQEHAFTYRRIDKYHLYDFYNFKSKKIKDRLIRSVDSVFRKAQRLLKLAGIYRRYSPEFPVLYAGATWWSLTYDMCKYIVEYMDTHPAFYKRFLHTQSSDEILIQTLVMNSPYRDNAINNNLRYSYFEKKAPHPNPLTMAYIDGLKQEDKLFARKFTAASKELLDYLDKNVY
ncbi:MAG: hypothetical protein JWQ38_790 [Flavipsychrobacter sp.]|nr:hypothetical protein [Flavipsychrobacter sp.]